MKVFMWQDARSATVNSPANNEVLDGPWQLLHFLACLSSLGPQAGSAGIQDLSPHGSRRVWCCPAARVDPLSPRVGSHRSPCRNLQDHTTSSHAITLQTSYLKIHRCCKTGRTERENIFFIVSSPPSPPPFIHFSSLFLFSSFYLSQAASTGVGREYVWSDIKLLFYRQEPTEGLWLRKRSTSCIDNIFGLFFGLWL